VRILTEEEIVYHHPITQSLLSLEMIFSYIIGILFLYFVVGMTQKLRQLLSGKEML
jgi:hypothetical protein